MNKFNPFAFQGRLGRLQYFGFSVIIGGIIAIAYLMVSGGSDPTTGEMGGGEALTILVGAVVAIAANFSYGVRRLHDFDKSGWWFLFMLIPFVNIVMGLILLFAPPTPGENRYGVR